MSGRIVFVLKGYPRLSETFIAQEIRALERNGIDLRIVSLRHPTEAQRHPVHGEIRAKVSYLPEYLHRELKRVVRAWWAMRRRASYANLWRKFCADFRRSPSRNIVRRFGQGLVMAAESTPDDIHFHAHFLHTPATVTHYASILTGKTWSASAHAKDIWTSEHWDLKEKLAACQWAVTCTRYNCEHLRSIGGDEANVSLVYHGLDLEVFDSDCASTRCVDQDEAVIILSVGRLVEKKGYDDLLVALSLLPSDLAWKFVHIGGGQPDGVLRSRAETLGITHRVTWRGAQSQAAVLEAYRNADLFVLASRIADDGDRDGLPNVLMEAQSQGLACVSTRVSAIPELVIDDFNGLLVEPGEPLQMARALEELIRNPALRERLGNNGRQRVATTFSLESNITTLVERFLAVHAATQTTS